MLFSEYMHDFRDKARIRTPFPVPHTALGRTVKLNASPKVGTFGDGAEPTSEKAYYL